MKEVVENVKNVVSEQTNVPVEEIKEDSKLTKELGMDSLDYVECIMALEEKFNIEISDEEVENIGPAEEVTVKDIISLVENKLAQNSG